MITSLLASTLLTGVVEAADYPDVEYRLQLDDYSINTVDYQFPSGLRILFQEDNTQPIVSITNWFDRGSIYDGVNEHGESVEGIAHAVEHLAFRAKHGDLPKNWDVINQLGGILNASTSREWTNYMTIAPVDSAIPLLRIEALRLADGVAGVTEADIESEKSIVRNELRMGYESGANGSAAIRTAFVHVPKLLYPEGHAYESTTIGSHETIGNITLSAVQRYVEENYRPEFSTIVMVGAIDTNGDDFLTDENGDFVLNEAGEKIRASVPPFNMIMDAFVGIEHLLMTPEDAAKYQELTDEQEQIAFLNEWFPRLEEYIVASAQKPPEPRVDCDNREEPPEPRVPYYLNRDNVLKISGMVDYPTAIAAWTMPSGYCDDDTLKSVAANMLGNYVYQTLDPEFDPTSQEREIENFGCFADVDKRSTIIMCMVEKGSISKLSAERILDKIGDALYLQWQPIDQISKPFVDASFTSARMSFMSDVLGMTDNVASLWGRATIVSQHTHYTGSPAFFSDTINSYNNVEFEPIRELAQKYLTRERMVGMVIEPMDQEARERLEASASDADQNNEVAGEHRSKDDRSRQLFDPESLTPEVIESVAVVPDAELIHQFVLDNGLQVSIMNHGEAPLVKIGLEVVGSNSTAPVYGLNSLAENLYDTAKISRRDNAENPMAVAGSVYRTSNMIYASGSSANLEALLHKTRRYLGDYDWKMANKSQRIKGWKNGMLSRGKKPEEWATRMRTARLFPDHIYGTWMNRGHYDTLAEAGTLSALKEWTATKWQPANAHLVIVGKIEDVDSAEALTRSYFESWTYDGSGTPGAIVLPGAPSALPERQVLLFDKPIATQSKVRLTCQIKKENELDRAQASVIGEALTFLAFERLREEKGITYGAYASPYMYDGDAGQLAISSVIQNSGVAFGVQTMFDLVSEARNSELSDDFIATNKWNVARTMVTSQQSGDQMLTTLLGPGRNNIAYYEQYPRSLATVSAASIADMMEPCEGHEIVTVVGPVSQLTGQLDEAGIAYEVVDWEGLYESMLTKKELKKYRKAKAKAEKKAAKAEAKEEAAGETEGAAE
jgi:predicted Zn-dependent peptidase